MKEFMQIGEIAKLAQVNIQTIRYYEKRGVLRPQKRKESGYRLYTSDTVKTLNFVRHAKELGFTLAEIKDLLALRATTPTQKEKVRKKASKKLLDIQSKLKLLRRMEKNLKALIEKCQNQTDASHCAIIESLEET